MRKAIAGVLAGICFLAIALGSCSAETGEEKNTTASQEGEGTSGEGASSEPSDPNQVGNWEIVGDVNPKDDGLGDFKATFRVRNTSDHEDNPLMTVNVLKGDNLMGSLDCVGPSIEPGNIGTVDCISSDPYKQGWTEVTIENSF